MKLPKIKPTTTNALNLVGAVVIIYLLVLLGGTIKRNYDLGKQIDTLRVQIAMLQDQKDQLAYDIQYYGTNSFRDREARSKLDLQAPGENVVIIPHTSPSPTPASKPSKTTAKKSNLQQWFDFLSGRTNG